MGYEWVTSELQLGYKGLMCGLLVDYEWVISGLQVGYKWVTS